MSKNKVEVVIGGLIYALQGEESEEHMQKVARLINEKTYEVQSVHHNKQRINPARMNMLVTLNIADECVKRKQELERYAAELAKCNEENLALRDKIKEISLELTESKQQLAVKESSKKKEHTNRGR